MALRQALLFLLLCLPAFEGAQALDLPFNPSLYGYTLAGDTYKGSEAVCARTIDGLAELESVEAGDSFKVAGTIFDPADWHPLAELKQTFLKKTGTPARSVLRYKGMPDVYWVSDSRAEECYVNNCKLYVSIIFPHRKEVLQSIVIDRNSVSVLSMRIQDNITIPTFSISGVHGNYISVDLTEDNNNGAYSLDYKVRFGAPEREKGDADSTMIECY